MTENDISYIIRGAIFTVYNTLGPGLLERIYAEALKIELELDGLKVLKEEPVDVYYREHKLDIGFRMDLLVEDKVIIEVKSVEKMTEVFHLQTLSYLRITKLKLGILVNFNVEDISKGIFRKVNKL